MPIRASRATYEPPAKWLQFHLVSWPVVPPLSSVHRLLSRRPLHPSPPGPQATAGGEEVPLEWSNLSRMDLYDQFLYKIDNINV